MGVLHIHSLKDNLWIKWIHVYYLRGRNIWTWNPSKADHPVFKNIQKLRDYLKFHAGSINQAQVLLGTWYRKDKFSSSMAYNWLRTIGDRKPWMSSVGYEEQIKYHGQMDY